MKQRNVFKVATLLLSMFLASCSFLPNMSPTNRRRSSSAQESEEVEQSSIEDTSYHKHIWGEWYTVREATCAEKGLEERVCQICYAIENRETKKTAHDWGEWIIVSEASCTQTGYKERQCKICGSVAGETIPPLGHDFEKDMDGNEIINWTTTPTCTRSGYGTRTCARCNYTESYYSPAPGHKYEQENGRDKITVIVSPTCIEGGIGERTCAVCGYTESAELEPLGHNLSYIDNPNQPSGGIARARVAHCSRCNDTFLNFNVSQASPNSGCLVNEYDEYTGDLGKRFLGHPIGNDVPLNDNGDADIDNHEAVFNENTMGDYFEFIFDLTAEQVAALGETVACYVDAKPANYLNSKDFWAEDPFNEEWTQGYYIEGEKKGQPIDQYRYILYVDNHPVEFDSRIKAPVPSTSSTNIPRAEFIMPYVFHLHTGSNLFRLHMAGGYRSTFFNFIFRPYDVPEDISLSSKNIEIRQNETSQIASPLTGLTYKSADTSIATVSESGLVTGVSVGETTITVSKEGNYFDAEIAVKINEKYGVLTFEAEDGFISDPTDAFVAEPYSSGASTTVVRTYQSGATYTKVFNQNELAGLFAITMIGYGSFDDISAVMSLTINGAPVTISGEFNSSSGSSNTTPAKVIIGQANLVIGENTMTITSLSENMPEIDSFRFDPIS